MSFTIGQSFILHIQEPEKLHVGCLSVPEPESITPRSSSSNNDRTHNTKSGKATKAMATLTNCASEWSLWHHHKGVGPYA